MARMRFVPLSVLALVGSASALVAQSGVDVLIPAGVDSGLPVVEANDNRMAAGRLRARRGR